MKSEYRRPQKHVNKVATIEVDQFLPHSVEVVWEAITDREQLAEWFMANDFSPEVGHRFFLDTGPWGITECEVLEVAPQRLLRYSWRNGPLDTEVTWRLVPEGRGTRLFVEHAGFDPEDPPQTQAFNRMAGGWDTVVLNALASHLKPA